LTPISHNEEQKLPSITEHENAQQLSSQGCSWGVEALEAGASGRQMPTWVEPPGSLHRSASQLLHQQFLHLKPLPSCLLPPSPARYSLMPLQCRT
jgi:hypothetical protein